MTHPTENDAEAAAFDSQIDERVAHGMIPDLRRVVPCDWFRNNPWRRPAYVALDYGEIHARLVSALQAHGDPGARILEVGCGPGHISLEVARSGFPVVGIDLSSRCIAVAQRVADEDPWREDRAPLTYACADFLQGVIPGPPFDAIAFIGSLHHFSDQSRVASRIDELLVPGGMVVVHEPTRDRATRGLAAFVEMVRILLSTVGHFDQPAPIPQTLEELTQRIDARYAALRYENEAGQPVQSPHDNGAGFAEMIAMLDSHCDRLEFEDTSAFFHELIGGLRFDETTNEHLASFMRDIDRVLVRERVLVATEFFYVGRSRRGGPLK